MHVGASNKGGGANKKINKRGLQICASTSNFDLLAKRHFFWPNYPSKALGGQLLKEEAQLRIRTRSKPTTTKEKRKKEKKPCGNVQI